MKNAEYDKEASEGEAWPSLFFCTENSVPLCAKEKPNEPRKNMTYAVRHVKRRRIDRRSKGSYA